MKEKDSEVSLHWDHLSMSSALGLAYYSSLPSLYFSALELIKCQSYQKKFIALVNKMLLPITTAENLAKSVVYVIMQNVFTF